MESFQIINSLYVGVTSLFISFTHRGHTVTPSAKNETVGNLGDFPFVLQAIVSSGV